MSPQAPTAPSRRVRFAVLGDAEPKPYPVFVNLEKAVETINQIHRESPIDFVASIGDITHRGTLEQYENATPILQRLTVPLFGIMGNEEVLGGKERFFEFATRWNRSAPAEANFVRIFEQNLFIFATASINGVQFSEEDLAWLTGQIAAHADRKIILFTHAPARGVFAAEQARTIPNPDFNAILRIPNLHLHYSGHTHMDPDFIATYAIDSHGVHHIHASGLERTKVGTTHTPRFHITTMEPDGCVDIQSYNLNERCFEPRHQVQFKLN